MPRQRRPPSESAARSSAHTGQSAYRVLNNRTFYRACLNCRVAAHGANHPSGKRLARARPSNAQVSNDVDGGLVNFDTRTDFTQPFTGDLRLTVEMSAPTSHQ